MLNILTIDLEEWYHPEYVRNKMSLHKEERIQQSLKITLDLLNRHNLKATFFVVGELVEKHPEIVENIRENNHEVAFHGYYHEPLWNLDANTLNIEIEKFNSLIKEKCIGFRAPSFSLCNKTKWALKILENAGYNYDSSIFPTKTPLYGVWRAPSTPYKPSYENLLEEDDNVKLWELPLLSYSFTGLKIPAAGGFYFRFLPYTLITRAIKKMNEQGFPAVVFFHNWELDPETPRLKLDFFKSFVTYHKLEAIEKKLESLLSKFRFTGIKEYMKIFNLT